MVGGFEDIGGLKFWGEEGGFPLVEFDGFGVGDASFLAEGIEFFFVHEGEEFFVVIIGKDHVFGVVSFIFCDGFDVVVTTAEEKDFFGLEGGARGEVCDGF